MRYNYNDLYIVEKPTQQPPSPSEIDVSHFIVETNASAFGSSDDLYVLSFYTVQSEFKDYLFGVTVQFTTEGDATWEYDTEKVMDLSSLVFTAFKANGGLIAQEQTIALDGASLDYHFGFCNLVEGQLGFDIIFSPNSGTFNANTPTPLLKVDVWTY